MGKIRIKTLGSEEEQAQKERAKVRREEKKKRLTHIAGLKGGERVVDMGATAPEVPPPTLETSEEKASPARKTGPKRQRKHSQKYLLAKKLIEPGKLYPLSEAIDLVKKTSLSHFDGSVEVHINTIEKGLRGQVGLPHGTGRQIRVAIADPSPPAGGSGQDDAFDSLMKKIETGVIDFDILVATPGAMPKLAKVAKILGPRGLMPNPKNGTIGENPKSLAEKLSKGQLQFKTESEAPIIHFVIGKVSFPTKDLEENFQALVSAIDRQKIKSVFLKSTMSPAIKVAF